MIVGVTGGMGCGKSAASRLLAARGFRLVDSDLLIRERVLTAATVVEGVREVLGVALQGRSTVVMAPHRYWIT